MDHKGIWRGNRRVRAPPEGNKNIFIQNLKISEGGLGLTFEGLKPTKFTVHKKI